MGYEATTTKKIEKYFQLRNKEGKPVITGDWNQK